jgi:hypothetical protein
MRPEVWLKRRLVLAHLTERTFCPRSAGPHAPPLLRLASPLGGLRSQTLPRPSLLSPWSFGGRGGFCGPGVRGPLACRRLAVDRRSFPVDRRWLAVDRRGEGAQRLAKEPPPGAMAACGLSLRPYYIESSRRLCPRRGSEPSALNGPQRGLRNSTRSAKNDAVPGFLLTIGIPPSRGRCKPVSPL